MRVCLCLQEEQGMELHSLNIEALQQLKYTGCVIKETLRINPPVPGGFRVALKTFELNVSWQRCLWTECAKGRLRHNWKAVAAYWSVPLINSGLPNSQRLERHLQHLWHPWCRRDLPQQGGLPAGALHDQTFVRLLQVPVHPVRRGLQNVCRERVCKGPAEDLPGGGGHKVSLDSAKWATRHEDGTYRLSCWQSANQVHQLYLEVKLRIQKVVVHQWLHQLTFFDFAWIVYIVDDVFYSLFYDINTLDLYTCIY